MNLPLNTHDLDALLRATEALSATLPGILHGSGPGGMHALILE